MRYMLGSAYYLNGQYSLAKPHYLLVQQLSPGFLTTETMLSKLKDKGF